MRILAALLAACGMLHAADTLNIFGYRWTVPVSSDWKVDQEDGAQTLHLIAARGPLPGPRRPIQFALAETPGLQAVSIDAEVRPLGHSLIFVFAHRDPAHFDYAHLSTDAAKSEPVHNGIFHVYGGERVRISPEDGPAAFSAGSRWYHVRLDFDGASGTVDVTVDQRSVPALHAVDLSLRSGRIGIGSFDETAEFRNIKINEAASR
ncbi:MAG: hypothetical protein JOY54_10490 [Acidobacteriaceae bacterium]|nr:hypothetical protein [Acidobacteriaceae bacterium]